MKYFVTGATGFLGGRVVELLLARGDEVIALGRNALEGARLQSLGATFVTADLTDREILAKNIPLNCNVIHCAALSSPWGKESAYFKSNVLGTQVLSDVALEKQVKRFIHISTPSVYVEKCSKELIIEAEELPSKMINSYARTKLAAERLIKKQVELGLPAIILRPQGIFGPRDQAILPRLIRVAQKGYIPVINENVKIDLTYVDNVVEAIFCAIKASDEFIGQTYNITNDEPVDQTITLEFLLEKIGLPVKRKKISAVLIWNLARAMEWTYQTFKLKGEPILTRYTVCTLAYTRTLSIEKAKRELNYLPLVSMKKGLERTILWFVQSAS